MMSSFLEVYAAQNKVATVNNKVVEKKAVKPKTVEQNVEKPKRKKKTE
jgi:hypothetical protein